MTRSSSIGEGWRVLLLDIEGTTTPISFVVDVLFPYARHNVEAFLTNHFDDPAVAADRAALAAEEGIDATSIPELVAAVHRQMDVDQKTTALKSLQGKIWKAGYENGSLQSVVFDDVPTAMRAATQAGIRVCIYSSGSIAAQKLLFGYTEVGDLSPMISGWFDTTTGPKKQARSYELIATDLGVDPSEILFCTDVVDEAHAAREAGVNAVILQRPGNPETPAHDFEIWQTLSPIMGQ